MANKVVFKNISPTQKKNWNRLGKTFSLKSPNYFSFILCFSFNFRHSGDVVLKSIFHFLSFKSLSITPYVQYVCKRLMKIHTKSFSWKKCFNDLFWNAPRERFMYFPLSTRCDLKGILTGNLSRIWYFNLCGTGRIKLV